MDIYHGRHELFSSNFGPQNSSAKVLESVPMFLLLFSNNLVDKIVTAEQFMNSRGRLLFFS
jgi:hypothetical protein